MSGRTWHSQRETADEAACAPQLVHVSRQDIFECLGRLCEQASERRGEDDPAERWRAAVRPTAPQYLLEQFRYPPWRRTPEYDAVYQELHSPHFAHRIKEVLPEFLGRTCLLCGSLEHGTHKSTCRDIDHFLEPNHRLRDFGPLYCRRCGISLCAFARGLGATKSWFMGLTFPENELAEERAGLAVAMLVASGKFQARAKSNAPGAQSWRFNPRHAEKEDAELIKRRGWI